MAKPSIGFELSAIFSAILPPVWKSSTVNSIEFVMVRATFPARFHGRRTLPPAPSRTEIGGANALGRRQ
jgi:hypothetical protein